MTLLAILALGFFLGMRHATDADHVVAVSTIVSRERRPRGALLIGALWGLGHTVTILVVGGAVILFGVVIPPRLGLSMELSVAVMLVVLGAMNLKSTLRRIEEVRQGEGSGVHAPVREGGALHSQRVRPLVGVVRPIAIGIVHGLAGSAGVALLVLATIRDAALGVFYLALFGLGTLVGMMMLTLAMSVPMVMASRRLALDRGLLARITGVASVVVGLALAYQVAVVDGLFVGPSGSLFQ